MDVGAVFVKRGFVVIVCLLALSASGCSPRKSSDGHVEPARLRVAVTVAPQAHFVERLGGDRVSIQVLLPPGAGCETYEPTVAQLEELAKADVYVKVGVPGYEFETTLFEKMRDMNRKMRVVDSSEGVRILEGNPHIWLSVRDVKTQVKNIALGLVAADPKNRELYERNEAAFLLELDALDAEIRKMFETAKHKRFMGFHPCWTYFARDYGLHEIAIEDHGKEPDAAALGKLIDTAKTDGIKTVFVQPQFSEKSAQIIADALGGRLEPIDPMSREWADNQRRVAEALAAEMR